MRSISQFRPGAERKPTIATVKFVRGVFWDNLDDGHIISSRVKKFDKTEQKNAWWNKHLKDVHCFRVFKYFCVFVKNKCVETLHTWLLRRTSIEKWFGRRPSFSCSNRTFVWKRRYTKIQILTICVYEWADSVYGDGVCRTKHINLGDGHCYYIKNKSKNSLSLNILQHFT